MIHARIYLYEFYSLFNTGEFEKVAQLQKDNTGTVLEKVSLLDMKLQLELYLSLVVWSLAIGDITEARKQMKKILSAGKSFYIYHPYRVVRLVNLILQAETGNYDFFENEIKSIRRSYQSDKKEYVTEKYLFKFVQEYPLSKSKQQKLRAWQKYNFGIKELVMNNSERPLLKYFNFYAYIEGKLTDISFQEIMQKHNALIKANMR